eukprot:7378767-Prymnesium_polylepis.2
MCHARPTATHTRARGAAARRGGDDSWFAGTVLSLQEGGAHPQQPQRTVTVIYDDGEEWTGTLDEIYLLQGDDDDDAPPPPAQAVPIATATAVAAPPVQDRTR